MNFVTAGPSGTLNLQATLSASSACSVPVIVPHHPITCQSRLRLYHDGTFACDHAAVPEDDQRTQFCIDHSIALLLVELAVAML
jgi:hypothetical protein